MTICSMSQRAASRNNPWIITPSSGVSIYMQQEEGGGEGREEEWGDRLSPCLSPSHCQLCADTLSLAYRTHASHNTTQYM